MELFWLHRKFSQWPFWKIDRNNSAFVWLHHSKMITDWNWAHNKNVYRFRLQSYNEWWTRAVHSLPRFEVSISLCALCDTDVHLARTTNGSFLSSERTLTPTNICMTQTALIYRILCALIMDFTFVCTALSICTIWADTVTTHILGTDFTFSGCLARDYQHPCTLHTFLTILLLLAFYFNQARMHCDAAHHQFTHLHETNETFSTWSIFYVRSPFKHRAFIFLQNVFFFSKKVA